MQQSCYDQQIIHQILYKTLIKSVMIPMQQNRLKSKMDLRNYLTCRRRRQMANQN